MRKVGALLLVAIAVLVTILGSALLEGDEDAGEPFSGEVGARPWTSETVRRSREIAPAPPAEIAAGGGRIEIRFVASGERAPRRPVEVELLGLGKRTASDALGVVRWDLPPGVYRWIRRSGPWVEPTPLPEDQGAEAGVAGKAKTWSIDGMRPTREASGPIRLAPGETIRLTARVHDGIRLRGRIPMAKDACRIEVFATRTRRHPADAAADIHERVSCARTDRTTEDGGFCFDDLAPDEHIVTAWWRAGTTHTFAHAEVLLEDDREHDLGALRVLDTKASLRITAVGFDPSGVRPSLSLVRKDGPGPCFTFLGSFATSSTFIGLEAGLWSVRPLGAPPFPKRLAVLAPDPVDLTVPGRDDVAFEYRLAPPRGNAILTFVLPDERPSFIEYRAERIGGSSLGFTAHGAREVVATAALDPGRYVVRATARADGDSGPTQFGSSETRIVAGESATVRIVLEPGVEMHGIATTPAGLPYDGPVVVVLPAADPNASFATVEAVRGVFAFFAPKGAMLGCMNGTGQAIAAPGTVLAVVVDGLRGR